MAVSDTELVAQLAHARGWRRVLLAAALGDTVGTEGPAALRALVQESGPGTQDLRCAAILALARRCGEEATADYIAALSDRNGAVRDYARIGLAAYGSDGGWDLALDQLSSLLRRPPRPSTPSSFSLLVTYLVRHLDGADDRPDRLLAVLRRRWSTVDGADRAWLASVWPGIDPDSHARPADPPNVQAALSDIRWNPLLAQPSGALDEPDLLR